MVPTLLILTLCLAPPAPSTAPAEGLAAAHAVVQVSPEFGVEAVAQLMSSRSFAASIHPSLMPGHPTLWNAMASAAAWNDALANNELPPVGEGVSYVLGRLISNTLAAVTVVAADEAQAMAELEGILKSLDAMRSDRGRAVVETLSYKEDQRRELEARLAQALEHRAEHRARCQGVDPNGWQRVLQDRLMTLRQRQFTVATEVTVGQAMREHLVARLNATPKMIKREGDQEPNPAYSLLVAQMNRARKEYELLRQDVQQGFPPDADKTKKLLDEIERLETLMGSTPSQVRGPAKEVANPERRNLEERLAEQERDLAVNSVDLSTMKEGIASLAKEVLQYQLLVDQQQELEGELARLRQQKQALDVELESLRQEATRSHRAPVVVVTGPGLSRIR